MEGAFLFPLKADGYFIGAAAYKKACRFPLPAPDWELCSHDALALPSAARPTMEDIPKIPPQAAPPLCALYFALCAPLP